MSVSAVTSPGVIVALDDDYVDIATLDGVLRITSVATEKEPDSFLKPKDLIHNQHVVLT